MRPIIGLLLLTMAGCATAHATDYDLGRAKAETAGLFAFTPLVTPVPDEVAPEPPGVPHAELPAPPGAGPAPEPAPAPQPAPAPPARNHATSALGPASPEWTWPGDIYQHLAGTHGVSGTGLSHREAVVLHNRLHNASATTRVAMPQTVWRPAVQSSSNCPGGVCPLPAARVSYRSAVTPTVQRQSYSVRSYQPRRGLFGRFRRR